MPKSKIPTLSLFSGAGGLDLGFEQAGFDILACVEIEKSYCLSLEKNVANGRHFSKRTKVYCTDIRDFDPEPYKGKGIKCVIGGPPCQTFSAAGRRSGGVIGTKDSRGQLYEAYCRILDVIQPEVFVFENVYGLPGANGGEPWQEIIRAFESHGYQLFSEVLDAADYGVPQHRERLIMIGCRSGQFVFPMPTHGPDSPTNTPLVSVMDAISDLPSPRTKADEGLGGMYGHLLPEVPEGLNYAYFTAEMGHPEPVFAWRSKFHDLLYKVKRDEPCRTIKAQPGKFTGPFHWENRHFTVAELKRLQSFPDDYEIAGSPQKVLEQIGNSVPPRLAYVIACSVKEQILEKKKKIRFPLREPSFKSTFRQRQRERSNAFKIIAKQAIQRKYGKSSALTINEDNIRRTSKYKVVYEDLFVRREVSRLRKGLRSSTVEIIESKNDINMSFRSGAAPKHRASIEIQGLKKYMAKYDTLKVDAAFSDRIDIFHIWQEIEQALVARSKFFTLIDIYGHYANRGDVVNITSRFHFERRSKIDGVIEFLSQTSSCGDFMSENDFWKKAGVKPGGEALITKALRELRFDFRTSRTHPIIGKGRVLCTYPFPLLSPRALVESRVSLTNSKQKRTA